MRDLPKLRGAAKVGLAGVAAGAEFGFGADLMPD